MAEKKNIKSSYTPSEKELQDLRCVYERYQDMKYSRENYAYGNLEGLWDSQEKRWEAYRKDEAMEDWQSDIFIPITTSIIESQLAEVIEQSPMPEITPVGPDDIITAATLDLIYKHTWKKAYSDVEHYKLLRTTFTHGTGIWQESFLDLPRKVKDLVKFDPLKGVEEYKEREIKDYYDVYGENVPLLDFFVDDKARYFEPGPYSARDCIRRYIMHVDDFREYYQGPIWDPMGNAKYVVEGGEVDYDITFTPPKGVRGDEVEVLWYYSRYPDDKFIIVANGVLIRSTPNPYKHKQLPFARSVDYMRVNQFYGKGDVELLESIQDELNTLRRMRTDRLHLDLDKMFKVSNREVLDDEDLIARPHGSIRLDDINGLEPLEYSPIHNSAYLEEDRLKEDAVRVTGINERFQGLDQRGTATEAAILRETTLKRIRAKMRIHEKMFLPRIATQRIANIKQYYSEPMVVDIVGNEKSAEYKQRVKTLRDRGLLEERDGKKMEKRYRTIPLKNKRMTYNSQRNMVFEEKADGWTFFEARPEFIRGEVEIEFKTGSSIPISKPLEQQRTEALLQHPLISIAIERGHYDLGMAADLLLEKHEVNPDTLKPRATQENKPYSLEDNVDPATEIRLAEEQNMLLMQGEDVEPTPFITSRHVQIHIAFMRSPDFQQGVQNDRNVLKAFMRHVAGEVAILKQRERMGEENPAVQSMGGGAQSIGGAAPEGREFPASGIQPSPKKSDVIPGMIEGNSDSMRGMPR